MREAVCSPAYALAFRLWPNRDPFAGADEIWAAAKTAGVDLTNKAGRNGRTQEVSDG